jgi:hypothetical protein
MTDPLAIDPEPAGRSSFKQTRRYMLALRERRIREQQLSQAV